MTARYWPLGAGRIVTSRFGGRPGGYHWGCDFGRDGGSAGMPVYAAQAGTVIYAGPASGFGGPDPAGWVVIDHPTDAGSGTTVYGHIVREVGPGARVAAGQRIGHINPDNRTNGNVAPHLHFEVHRSVWVGPGPDRLDPLPWLAAAKEPGGTPMADTLFADVSEFQRPLDESYPYPWLSIRSNDGTYRDRNWRQNWDTARRMLDSGKLVGLIVYAVVRPNWQDSLAVHIEMQGENRPDVVSMADAESWGGQIVGDHSHAFNSWVWGVSDWRGGAVDGRPRRVIGYLNPNDHSIWPNRPPIGFVVPSYGAPPRFTAATADVQRQMIAHQFTDGQGYGGGLPEGAPPFGNCDMNAANGYSPADLAVALGISGEEDDMAFTDEDRAKLNYIFEQLGPKHADWNEGSSFGKNAKGEELTLRDGMASLKRTVEAQGGNNG